MEQSDDEGSARRGGGGGGGATHREGGCVCNVKVTGLIPQRGLIYLNLVCIAVDGFGSITTAKYQLITFFIESDF